MTAAVANRREFDTALVQEALKRSGSRSRMVWLAEQLGVSQEILLPRAARHFGARALDMAALRQMRPDFGVVSFAECQRRGCLVGRFDNEHELTVVVADPTDTRLRQWLEVRLHSHDSGTALATAADLQAFLVAAEKSVRAMDAVHMRPERAAVAGEHALTISISHIDATESPVVRLVDSTLYDALRDRKSVV